MTIHKLNLASQPFIAIASGNKIIESRLNDAKRRAIAVGDEIQFTNRDDDQTLQVEVLELIRADNFEQLFASRPATEFGKPTTSELLAQINQFYSTQQQREHGVVGIKFRVIPHG